MMCGPAMPLEDTGQPWANQMFKYNNGGGAVVPLDELQLIVAMRGFQGRAQTGAQLGGMDNRLPQSLPLPSVNCGPTPPNLKRAAPPGTPHDPSLLKPRAPDHNKQRRLKRQASGNAPAVAKGEEDEAVMMGFPGGAPGEPSGEVREFGSPQEEEQVAFGRRSSQESFGRSPRESSGAREFGSSVEEEMEAAETGLGCSLDRSAEQQQGRDGRGGRASVGGGSTGKTTTATATATAAATTTAEDIWAPEGTTGLRPDVDVSSLLSNRREWRCPADFQQQSSSRLAADFQQQTSTRLATDFQQQSSNRLAADFQQQSSSRLATYFQQQTSSGLPFPGGQARAECAPNRVVVLPQGAGGGGMWGFVGQGHQGQQFGSGAAMGAVVAGSISSERSHASLENAQGAHAAIGKPHPRSPDVVSPGRVVVSRQRAGERRQQGGQAQQAVVVKGAADHSEDLQKTVQMLRLELTTARYHLLCKLEVSADSLCGPIRVLETESEEGGRRESPLEVHEFRGANALVRWVDAANPTAWSEVGILRSIPHPHVVQFYGVKWSADRQRVGIICRLPVSGHLAGLLLSWLLAGNHNPPADIRSWAVQLTTAIAHVHVSGYLHLNIASRHCWIDGQHGVQLFGFRGARRRGHVSTEIEGMKGYMAPEVIRGTEPPTEAADVCSLGFVLYEMLTLRTPFTGCSFEEIQSMMAADCRPSFSMREHSLWPEWVALVDRCWAPDPHARPPLQLVLRELEQMPEPRQRLQPWRGVR